MDFEEGEDVLQRHERHKLQDKMIIIHIILSYLIKITNNFKSFFISVFLTKLAIHINGEHDFEEGLDTVVPEYIRPMKSSKEQVPNRIKTAYVYHCEFKCSLCCTWFLDNKIFIPSFLCIFLCKVIYQYFPILSIDSFQINTNNTISSFSSYFLLLVGLFIFSMLRNMLIKLVYIRLY